MGVPATNPQKPSRIWERLVMAANLARRMDIEAALRWAFRDELPKTGRERGSGALASSWGRVESYAQLADHDRRQSLRARS